MTKRCSRCVLGGAAMLLALSAAAARGDLRQDVGYTRLANEFQITLDGTGVPVAQIEANAGTGYFPTTEANPTSGNFAGKHFTFVTASGSPAISTSAHAQTVAGNYYGLGTGLAPGVTDVSVYTLEGWNEKIWHSGATPPTAIAARVANHSYLLDQSQLGVFLPPRLDYMTQVDDLIQTVAVNNNDVNPPAGDNLSLPIALNVITVGRSDLQNVSGSGGDNAHGPYVAGRTAPLLLAPIDSTSYAAPIVAGIAADLIQAANDHPEFSNGSYRSPRTGEKIYHAATSETIKAALLSGAVRTGLPQVYGIDTTNGLSSRMGAGQVNLFNSYQELAGGEQDAHERGNVHDIARFGFDYEPAITDRSKFTYLFTGDLARKGIIASLAWNAAVNSDISGSVLHNLNLELYDLTKGSKLIARSASTIESTENINFNSLRDKHKYALVVKPAAGQAAFTWDYGLAWRFVPDTSIRTGITDGGYDIRYGDSNGDGAVDQTDVTALVSGLGLKADATWSQGDFNGDGAVDFTDLNYLCAGSALAASPAPIAASVVPEPSILALLGLSALALRRRARQRAEAGSNRQPAA